MPNNTGLKFDPTAGLGNTPQTPTQSVPTIADDYMNTPLGSTLSLLNLKPAENSPLTKAWNSIQAWQGLSEEEQQKASDPLFNYNKWTLGLQGLEDSELKEWEDANYLKIQDKSDSYKERLWKNQQFVNAFGMDVFEGMPDKNERDELYEDYLLGEAINKKYESNPNIEQLRKLTPEGKKELLNSDYKSDLELDLENKKAKDKDWSDYSLAERYNAIAQGATTGAQTGMTIGTIVGGAVSGGAGTIPGLAIGGLIGWGSGAVAGLISPENAEAVNASKREINNDNILNKIVTADNDRKKEESKKDINAAWSAYNDAYRKGRISSQEIDDLFDDIALSGKKTYRDELGMITEYDYQGSNYYSAFKDTDEFEHFSTADKLKYIAQTQALAQKYGRDTAASILDQDMQSYISDSQTASTWLKHSLKNVWVGGVANLANNVTALGALSTYLTYSALHKIDDSAPTGEEALSNYLNGKDASGDGTDNWFNPMYWNKVDQYNTFDKDVIAKAEENGGISIYNNIVAPGTEGDFWSWNTLNEAVRMNKFAWSDLLKNLTLGKLVRGATRVAGGVELAPGVLATESTAASQAINSLGSIGVLNASSLGIDAAYGMQTYEEILRQNNAKLDELIAKETEAEVQRLLYTQEALDTFNNYVAEENKRRQQRVGENGDWFPVDETKAWNDYVERVTSSVRNQIEASHAQDRQQAQNDAANGYAIDASIEHLRMATTNGVFKSYLFDKGTLNALRNNNPYVATTTKDGLYAIGKHATRNKAWATLENNVWGGFHANYFDDVTVGFAEGFGIQDYNNYLLQKYNPAAYGSVLDEYVNPFLAAVMGANNSMLEGRSFLDGGIGALGTFFTVSPNVGGMMSHRQRMKEAAEAAKKQGKEKEGISTAEWMSDFINNPILQSYADAKAATRMTEAEVKRVNDLIKENGYALDNMVETVSALNQNVIAREGTSALEAEDTKDREAFTLATNLLSLRNSAVVQNAQAEPNKAGWSKKKRAAKLIGQGLNAMLGIPMFGQAESSYTNAIQSLQDAAAIGETSDAEVLARQEELVKTFIGLDQNKNAIQGMSEEEKTSFAQERLKKNASRLLDMMNTAEELQGAFENSIQAQFHPDVKQQLMYQYALNGRWKDRQGDLEEKITGEKEHQPLGDRSAILVARYGSMKGFERAKESQEKRVENAKQALEKAKIEAKKGNDPTKSLMENSAQKAIRMFTEKAAAWNLKKEETALQKIKAEGKALETIFSSETPEITAEDILRLNANDRLRMLDDYYRSDYSEAQQTEIDKAKNLLISKGATINEAMEWVKDAAILQNRIDENMEVAKRIMQNPIEANQMQQALIENRKRAVIDYFNDKVVADAFHDFTKEPESIISQEKVAEKAANYSTAVLNGMLREVERQLGKTRTSEEMDDKTLSNLEEGIKSVLKTRDDRLKETADLDKYIRKTKKVDHTNIVYKSGENFGQQVTTERELSQNDKKLLDDALDYAAERGISIDQLPDAVMTDEFNNYVQEKNHAYELTGNPITGKTYETNVGIVENRVNPVSPEYVSELVNDVVSSFKVNKDKVQAVKSDKQTAPKPESVATQPVETKGSKPGTTTEEEKRPDEVDPSDPLGIKKRAAAAQATATPAPTNDRNAQIMEEAALLNSKILEDVGILLDEVDRLSMDDRTREKLKDLISARLSSTAYTDINRLQGLLAEDAMLTSEAEAPQIAAKAAVLANLNIKDIKDRKAASSKPQTETADKQEGSTSTNPLPPTPLILETRDLDNLINYPVWKDYITKHGVVSFLQKLSDAWNKETEAWRQTGKQGYLHQSQVVFIYDPALASAVSDSYGDRTYNPEIDAPILMAIEITDRNKHLVDNADQLITIKDKTNNEVKQYQMIGAMPASEVRASESDAMRATAVRMARLRSRINFDDADAHVLRYAPQNDTGKYNGTVIKTNIEKVSSHTEDSARPFGTAETPKTGVQQLMEDNLNSATEAFVTASEEERRAYDEVKSKGLSGIKSNKLAKNLYERMVGAFISRLFKRERTAPNPEDGNPKELNFRLQKGTSDSYPKIVLIKKIGETLDKNTGRPIVDVLRETDDRGSNAQEVIDSNSRFKRLFNQLKHIKVSSGLFNQAGEVINKAGYDKALREYEGSIQKIIDNNLYVDDMAVRVDISEGTPAEKTVNIHVYSGDVNNSANMLATLTTSYTGQISQAELATFLKNLILDKDGNTRPGLDDSRFERVKWQVNYEDANTANGIKSDGTRYTNEELKDEKTRAMIENARNNLNDLYDDGVFEMQVTKLAYPSRSVTVGINPAMKERLYSEEKATPETPVSAATESKTAFEAETPGGKVDGDSGMRTEAPTKERILGGIPRVIIDTINRMISDSKSRTLSPDGTHYSIGGQLWSRVTSIKYALDKMGSRFDPNSPWAVPSSLIGNSIDEFGRDVFNGVFDNMTEAERMSAFEGYDNSTAKNYAEAYQAFKAFEARLAGNGQVVIATGTKDNPGHITAKGKLDVAVRENGRTTTRKVRVAGTLDVLAIDDKGNLHIYDFKTKHNNILSKEEAESESKGYDRQLSMYAKFLEDEYGLKVKSINIIPIKVEYADPRTQADYKESRPGSNQLMKQNAKGEYEEFNGANYEVGKEFSLTRLNDSELIASFDKMSEAEKAAIVEAIQDQSDTPAAEAEVKTEDIVKTEPEISQTEEEEEEGGRSRKGRLGRRGKSQQEVSSEETAKAINPEDNNGLLNKLKNLETACRRR